MPFNPFSALTSKIFGALLVVALVVVGVQTVRLSAAQDALEDKRNELATCEARHAVTRQSVAALEADFKRLMGEASERAAAFEQAKLEAERDRDRLRGEARESDAKIARLRQMAQQPSDGRCEVPADLLRELRGL